MYDFVVCCMHYTAFPQFTYSKVCCDDPNFRTKGLKLDRSVGTDLDAAEVF